MSPADKSIAIPTGMIIAALYVILLVGFARESYMRRDADRYADGSRNWPVVVDESARLCRLDTPQCAAIYSAAGKRLDCTASYASAGPLISAPMVPLTLEALRRAMSDDP